MKIVFPCVNSSFCKIDWRVNFGKPLATFISAVGFWNEGLDKSGEKASEMLLCWFTWLMSVNHTDCLNGQLRRLSCSDFIMTKKTEMWVPFSIPSPFKGIVSLYKGIFSNGNRMGIPIIQSSTWAMWFWDVHLPVPGQPSYPCARDRACTLALASEIDFASVLKDAEGPAYLSFRCVAQVS